MENSLAVANYFIKKAQESGYEVTPMKLIKLVYIAHGWHLGLYKKPLIEDGVQAWQYGPVIENIYHTFKKYGSSRIEKPEGGFLSFNTPEVKNQETKELLDAVWEQYCGYTGTQLSSLTHQPNTPWDYVWNTKGKRELFSRIPNDVIQEHYEQIINGSKKLAG